MTDLQSIVQQALLKFKGMTIDQDVLNYMAIEVNDILKRVSPEFRKVYYVEPYFIKDESKIKFNLHRIH